jgi:hypothetical protein
MLTKMSSSKSSLHDFFPPKLSPPVRHHLLIGGTGRAGTSLLVRILDACGLDTVLRQPGSMQTQWFDAANAGLETDLATRAEAPYVVKSPLLYAAIKDLITRPSLKIDGIIIPVRDLAEASTSRIAIEIASKFDPLDDSSWDASSSGHRLGAPGGAVFSLEPMDQARLLAVGFHTLIETLLEHDVPLCLIKFPKFTTDLEYLYRQLRPFLPDTLSLAEFRERVGGLVDASKVRLGQELASPQLQAAVLNGYHAAEPRQVRSFPDFTTAENIALKRELLRITNQSDVELVSKSVLQHAISEVAHYRQAYNETMAAYTSTSEALTGTQGALNQTQAALDQTQAALAQTQAAYDQLRLAPANSADNDRLAAELEAARAEAAHFQRAYTAVETAYKATQTALAETQAALTDTQSAQQQTQVALQQTQVALQQTQVALQQTQTALLAQAAPTPEAACSQNQSELADTRTAATASLPSPAPVPMPPSPNKATLMH